MNDIKSLCDQVRQTAWDIHVFHAHGHLEKVYENTLAHRLRKAGLTVAQQHPIKVYDEDGTVVGDYLADLLVNERLIVELKAAKTLSPEHEAQILGYLKSSRLEHGLLINFGSYKFEIRKFAWTEGQPQRAQTAQKFTGLLASLFFVFSALFAVQSVTAQDSAASAKAASDITAWTQLPRDKRPELPAAVVPLTKADAAAVTKTLWEDHAAKIKAERAEEMKAKVIKLDGKEMKFEMLKFGDLKKGQPLFISMHGGGNAPPQLNDSQWENQIKLGMAYKPSAGIYLAPRAPTNSWNLWHEAHIDKFFDRLIENLVVLADVDPNKVYFMGYSAGGDGTFQLAPRMADRLAAASMMAGHPNETSPLGLRNIGFTIHVGGEDGGFNRNKIAGEWAVKLDELQKADPKGYQHWVHVHAGRPHWMNLEDKEAIPWMEKFTRNPLPDKVVWQQDDVTHDRLYWLALPKGEAKGGQNITAQREGQTITITTKDAPKVKVLLSDALLNMDEPVSITLNGKAIEPKKPQRTAAVILRTLEERGDPGLVFSGEISVP